MNSGFRDLGFKVLGCRVEGFRVCRLACCHQHPQWPYPLPLPGCGPGRGGYQSYDPKGPMTQMIGFWGPNTISIMVFGP